MKSSKSKLIVAIIVISVIVIALITGVYLYFATDLFKGDQELFFKYLSKNGQVLETFTKNETKLNINDKYTSTSEITFNLESNDSQIANQTIPARNFTIKSSAKVDPNNNKDSRETTLKFLDKDLFTLKYLRNDDLYALTSDEVIKDKYLAIDNNNLKEFATKLGIADTTLIPDKIQSVDIEKLLSINEDLKKEILQKYLKVINNQIPKEKYTSKKDVTIVVDNKNVTTTAYSLELNQKEVIDVLTKVLDTLKTDETTLNIIVEKVKLIDNQTNITTNDIMNNIQELIDGLDDIQIIDDETLKITVYVNNGELVRTEITGGNDTITIDTEKNNTSERVIITLDNSIIKNNTANLKKIEMAKQTSNDLDTIYAIVTLQTGDEIIKISVQSKTIKGQDIQNTTFINVNITDTTYLTVKIDTTITPDSTVEVETLTKENSATLNSFTPQYIQNLSLQIVNRLKSLYTSKLEYINTTQQEMNMTNDTQPSSDIENNTINDQTNNNTVNTII